MTKAAASCGSQPRRIAAAFTVEVVVDMNIITQTLSQHDLGVAGHNVTLFSAHHACCCRLSPDLSYCKVRKAQRWSCMTHRMRFRRICCTQVYKVYHTFGRLPMESIEDALKTAGTGDDLQVLY